MADTSLVFNLVARDRATEQMGRIKEKMAAAGAAIGAGVGVAVTAGVVQHLNMEAASDKLAAQLGLGPQKAAQVAGAAANVYQNAWGDSIETVNAAVKGVYQNIGNTSQAEGGLEGLTTKTLTLSDAMDADLGMTTAAVGQLMKTGLAKNADEAFDLIAKSMDTQANKAGDLMDVLNEYSTQFRRVGLDGATAIGLISQGLAGGAKDADQVADAIGQFGELTLSGGTAVENAFKSIGLNADTMAGKIGAGGKTAQQALQMTLDHLRSTKNEQTKLTAATALFGDPGAVMGDALFKLNPASAAAASGMNKAKGAADKLTQTMGDNAAHNLEKFKRKALGALGDVAGKLITFGAQNKEWLIPLAKGLGVVTAALVLLIGTSKLINATTTALKTFGNIAKSSAVKAVGAWIKMAAKATVSFLKIAVKATASAAKTAAVWLASAAKMAARWLAALVRVAIRTAAQFVMMAARAVIWAATMAAQWIIAMGPVGWIIALIVGLVILIIAKWDTIKKWTKKAWDWVWGKIKAIAGFIWNLFLNWTIVGQVIKHWDTIKKKTVAVWNAVVNWVKGIPHKLVSLFFKWTIVGQIIKHWDQIKSGTKRMWNSTIDWVKGIPGRIVNALRNMNDLLYNKGMDIVRGLWNGIKSMGAWLRNTLMGWARDLIPGPIADALGIASPSKVLADEVGRWVPAGISLGITSNLDEVKAAANLAADAAVPAPAPMGNTRAAAPRPLMAAGASGQQVRVVFDVQGADEDMKKMIRKMVRVDGRGNVQMAFGR